MPALLLAITVDLIGFGLVLPLLPFYAQAFNASAIEVTLIAALFSLAQFLTAPFWGRLSDRVGRKPVFLVCIAIYMAGFVILAFAQSLWMIFLGRILSGVGAGKIGIGQAMVADMTTPAQRARAMGLFGASWGVGMVLGPVLGLLLVGSSDAPDFRTPSLAAAGLAGLSFVLSMLLITETLPAAARRTKAETKRPKLSERFNLLNAVPGLMGFVLLMFAVSFVFTKMESVFGLWMQAAFGWGARESLAVFIGIGLLLILVQAGLVGPLRKRFGEHRLVMGGGLLLAGGLILPALEIPSLFYLSVGMICSGFGFLTPALSSLVSQAAPEESRGQVMGEYQSAGALGRIAGPLAGGWLFDHLGHNWPMTVGGFFLLLCLVLFSQRKILLFKER